MTSASRCSSPCFSRSQRASLSPRSTLHLLRSSVERADNDARWLREKQGEERLLAEVIRQAADRFRGGVTHQQHP